MTTVTASSFKLEFPLNDALPNTDHARDRLLAKIFKYRKTHATSQVRDDEDYALLYAYGELHLSNLSKQANASISSRHRPAIERNTGSRPSYRTALWRVGRGSFEITVKQICCLGFISEHSAWCFHRQRLKSVSGLWYSMGKGFLALAWALEMVDIGKILGSTARDDLLIRS